MFKRLFPVFLVAVLLAGVAAARPTRVISTNQGQFAAVSKSLFSYGPDNPRLYFGTVVRDTADEESFRPGPRPAPREAPGWISFFRWNLFSLLISR